MEQKYTYVNEKQELDYQHWRGSETCMATKYLESKYQSDQREMERQMLEIAPRDKIRSSATRKEIGVSEIIKIK